MKIIFRTLVVLSVIAGACSPKQKVETPSASQTAIREVTYKVEGMTCDHCEESIKKGVEGLKGIDAVEANYEDSTTRVRFDPSGTGEEEIVAAIEKRGYKVVRIQCREGFISSPGCF